MDKSFYLILFFILYALIPFLGAALFLLWRAKKNGERPPVEFILRRGPGESIRRKLAKDDEVLPFVSPLFAILPIGLASGIVVAAEKLEKPYLFVAVGIAGLILVAGVVVIVFSSIRYLTKFRNYRLGYLGERAVGEELERLLQKGYRVFHDVPVEKAKSSFNLDHVVVGPTGLFAIETKTRRKGRARPGFADHKVVYDGRQLIWPWTEDTYGLQQAINEADWLTKWVTQMTGLQVAAKPILTFPGWWVENKARGPVSVQNHKAIPANIIGNGVRVLEEHEIDLIARQLDARCRDVKD